MAWHIVTFKYIISGNLIKQHILLFVRDLKAQSTAKLESNLMTQPGSGTMHEVLHGELRELSPLMVVQGTMGSIGTSGLMGMVIGSVK